jgi:hypothetical protein
MGDIKLANWHAQRVIEGIEDLVNLCVEDDDKVRWNDTFTLYRQMIKVCIVLIFNIYYNFILYRLCSKRQSLWMQLSTISRTLETDISAVG